MSLIVKPASLSFSQRVATLPKLQEVQDFKLDSQASFERLKGLLQEKINDSGIPSKLAQIETFTIGNDGYGIDLIIKNDPLSSHATEAVILRVKTFSRGNAGRVEFIKWNKDESGENSNTTRRLNFNLKIDASMITDIYLEGFLETFANEISKWVEEQKLQIS